MNDIRHSSYNHDNPTSSKLTSKQLQKTPPKQHILVHAVKRIHMNKFYIYENIHKFNNEFL